MPADQKPSWWVDGAIPATPPADPDQTQALLEGRAMSRKPAISAPPPPPGLGADEQPPDVPGWLRSVLGLRDNVGPILDNIRPPSDVIKTALTNPTQLSPIPEAKQMILGQAQGIADRAAQRATKTGSSNLGIGQAGLESLLSNTVAPVDVGGVFDKIEQKNYAGAGGQLLGGLVGGALLHHVMPHAPEEVIPHLDRHADAIANIVDDRGGATYSLGEGDRTGQNQYAVATMPERDRELPITSKPGTPEFHQEVANHASNFIKDNSDIYGSDPRANVGVWHAPNGKLVMEVSGTTHDLPAAIEAGKKNNQYAVYDLKNGRDILTDGTGGVLDKPAVDPEIRDAANAYNENRGAPPISGSYLKTDERAPQIADAYDALQHNPTDAATKRSYDAFKDDIHNQWDYATKDLGYTLEPWTKDGQPYANSKEMMKDVQDNKHLYYFQGGDAPVDHPMQAIDPSTGESYNNMFRAVHDLFGHAQNGFEFGPRGEENAWFVHKQMMSPEAVPAMTTETRGQNSWVNFGEHLRDENGDLPAKGQPGYIAPAARPFAEQKAGLLPPEFQTRNEAARLGDLPQSPPKTMVTLRHYSETPIKDEISGARRGIGATPNNPLRRVGSELDRLPLGDGAGGPAEGGWYGYMDGVRGEPQIVSRPNEYKISKMASIADISDNPVFRNAQEQALEQFKKQGMSDTQAYLTSINVAETALRKAGYDGYTTTHPAAPSGIVFNFGDQKLPEAPPKGGKGASRPFLVQPSTTGEGFASQLAQKQAEAQGDPGRAAVEAGGGVYGGKYGFSSMGKPEQLVVTDPKTNSTLAVPEEGVTPSLVRQALAQQKLSRFPESLLRPQEQIGPRSRQQFLDSVKKLPPMEDIAALMHAGTAGADWYPHFQGIYNALTQHSPTYFPEKFFKHFANVVGATSPNQPVERNMSEALNVWHAFMSKVVLQGRPVNVSNIRKYVLPAIESLKDAKQANLISALLGSSMFEGRNEYLKAPNFGAALSGDRDAFVGDTHMADAYGINREQMFKNSKQMYHALTVHTRAVAQAFNMDTRDAQAAVWSAKMGIDKLLTDNPNATPQEIADQLNPDVVKQSRKDFVDIIRTEPLVRQRLKKLGVTDVEAFAKQVEETPQVERSQQAGEAGRVPDGAGSRDRLPSAIQRIIKAEIKRKGSVGNRFGAGE